MPLEKLFFARESMKEISQVKVSPTELVRSDTVQLAAVAKDLGRGGCGPVLTRDWAAVQQGQREGTRALAHASIEDHRCCHACLARPTRI